MTPRLFRIYMVGLLLLLVSSAACRNPAFSPPDPTLPDVPAHTLLLQTTAFPPDWQIHPCAPYCEREEGFGDAARTYIAQDPDRAGQVIQHVRRHHTVAAATKEYQGYRETFFRKKPPPQTPSTDFIPPDQVPYQSTYADAYYFACGVDIVPACRFIARYTNYFVYMYFDIDTIEIAGERYGGREEGMPLQSVGPILRALDERVAAELEQPPGAPAPTADP